jgi:hypothetical protein
MREGGSGCREIGGGARVASRAGRGGGAAEDAASRFQRLGHPARAAKIRVDLKKRALFLPSAIDEHPASDGPSARRDIGLAPRTW